MDGRGMTTCTWTFITPTLEYVLRWHVIILCCHNVVAASLGSVHAVIRAASEARASDAAGRSGNFRLTLVERLGRASSVSADSDDLSEPRAPAFESAFSRSSVSPCWEAFS